MENKYTVTYKVAPSGAKYIYQEDKGKEHKKGDLHDSSGGHMWYSLSDGSGEEKSYGFESKEGKPYGAGNVTEHDNAAYQQTSAEITIALTKEQYDQLVAFSTDPQKFGFDKSTYHLLNNSCIDFVYTSLKIIGYNDNGYEGRLTPEGNLKSLHNMLYFNGAQIIRDDLMRNGDCYEQKDIAGCVWLSPQERTSSPETNNLIKIDINPTPQAQQHIQGENQAQQDAANGYLINAATHKVFAFEDLLNKTDFTSTQMASLASGGIRPGEVQLDPNARPNSWLSEFYRTPDETSDGNLLNAVALNDLAAMTTVNTYVDPLLLDLSGNGVHMTAMRDGVLFDTDHSGTLRRSGWADSQTGMLVIDDGSGQITNVSQMFSEYYGGKAGTSGKAGETPFNDGFAALASEDSNRDGVIDAHDAIWSKLRVWVDGTHDAKTDAGELKTLSELGITQINLRTTDKKEMREGNRIIASGTFIINGKIQEMLGIDFLGDPVSNTLIEQGAGTRVTSATDGTVTTAYASHSKADETLDAAQLAVNNLYGGSGNDTLIAAKSGSWLVGGAGSNHYVGGEGNDVFVISASDDTQNIHGNGGRDTAIIVGDRGVELNMADAGLILAEGGEGNDIIRSGGSSGVFIKGGSGNATLIGGMGSDVLVGGSGQNLIIGGGSKAVIYAGPQGDTIYASDGGSVIHAGGGADNIFGGAGDDVIEVGHGNATIDGKGGINLVSLHGKHGDYQITRTDTGYQVADKVAGRDGTVTLSNIQKLNFSDISAVDLQTSNAMPVEDVLTHDRNGKVFDRTQPHLIAAESLLANDQQLSSQGDLHIAQVGGAIGGTVSLTAQGDVLFTPDAAYRGLLSFKYGVADAAGNISASVMDLSSGQTAPMRASVTLLTPEAPPDPLAAQEWYLSDTNVLPVWEDYTGKGVRIGQFEPGGTFATAPEIFDISHPDLAANVDQAWLISQQASGTLPNLVSNHATMVAGVMVAAKNDLGGVGVAYGATLGGYYLANSGADLAGLGHMSSFDIANNSWGFTNDFALSNLHEGAVDTAASLSMNAQYAAANGRGGLGTVIVTAGGNNRAAGGSAQGSLTNNNRFSVEVGAINAQSDLSTLQIGSAPFSNPGASLLVSAPGSNVLSTSHMLETERGSTFGNDYANMQGTSFATPIVSGIVALMLEANPNLGYRDVQQILALSARKISDASTEWHDNQSRSWNGGGMHTSNDYGFGEVDARAAVRLSESWMTQSTAANEYVYSASSGPLGKTITAGATLTSSLAMNAGLNVEHVEIDFDAQVGRLGDLTLTLISPDGTESILLNRQGKVPDGMPGASAADSGSSRSGAFKYSFMSTHNFGERSAGNWTLQVTDADSGQPVTLNAWSLRLYGSQSSPDDTYFYTDEYLQAVVDQAGRAVLNDTVNGVAGGRNTLNAAAVSGDTAINLQSGICSLGGAALTIEKPATIQNIVTGEGNDTLIAWQADALLDGGRGRNQLTGGTGLDYFVVHRRQAGSDVINNFEAARGEVVDLVGFMGKTFADLTLTQQGANIKVDIGNGQNITLKNQLLSAVDAGNFIFHDTFISPKRYTSSDMSTHQAPEGLGTVVLKGGGKGVIFSSDAQGKMSFNLNGTIYSHDSATSDIFVIAAQPGVKNYQNALRGFRHGIDKIDLRQTGITDFSQLNIVQSNRGTINGLSQIHGVEVIRRGDGDADPEVKLLYLDTLETSQISADDFLFATPAPTLVEPVTPISPELPALTIPDPLVPTTPPVVPDNPLLPLPTNPVEWKPVEPIVIKPIEWEPIKPIAIKPIEWEPIKPIVIKPIEWEPIKPIAIKPIEPITIKPIELQPVTLPPSLYPVHSVPVTDANIEPLPVNNDASVITVKDIFANVTLGDESKTINVEAGNSKVIIGNGDNRVYVTGHLTDITVGDGNNRIESSGSFTQVKLGDGNNHVLVSGPISTIEVGHGINDLEFSGSLGSLVFGNDINPEQLWLQHTAQDLKISVIGSQQAVTLHNWYADTPERPRDIIAGDHHRLMTSQVENLVQAMSSFAPPASATLMFDEVEQQRLQPILTANWH